MHSRNNKNIKIQKYDWTVEVIEQLRQNIKTNKTMCNDWTALKEKLQGAVVKQENNN